MNTQHGMAVSTGALSWARKAGGALLLSLVLVPLQSSWAQMTCPNPLDVFPNCGGGGANTSPTFVVAGAGSLTVSQGASATDVKGLLHVSDIDAGQTMTWSQSAAPSHGTLSITGATASSGGADITPGGTITYTPTPGYSGADSFDVAISDGMGVATRTINVTISGRTVTVNALDLSGVRRGTYTSRTVTAAGGFGAYTYGVTVGALPPGLTLNTSTGELFGLPTREGDYGFTIQAMDSSTGTGPFSGTNQFLLNVGPQLPGPGLDDFPISWILPSVHSEVIPKSLTQGNGPKMVACLKDALDAQLGKATYEGQNADGSARFSIAGDPVRTVSFYPVNTSNASGNPALTATETNTMTVTTRCGTFFAVPALFNLAELDAVASTLNSVVFINEEAVITIETGDGSLYVGRPDYLVTRGTPGAPSLKQGDDGLWRFTDSLGNVQILRPAFLAPAILRTALVASLGAQFVSFVIQTDGSAVLTTRVNGTTQTAVLTPSLTLGQLSADHQGDSLWRSGDNWTYRVYVHTKSNRTQGYTSVQR